MFRNIPVIVPKRHKVKKMTIITENKNDRVMIFIDISNTNHKIADLGLRKAFLDYEELVRILLGERRLAAAYMFDSCSPESPKRNYHNALAQKGFRMDIRECKEDSTCQKEVDVAMARRMIVAACDNLYDVAIVVSGDRDFVPAVDEVQLRGKKVEVVSFLDFASTSLIRMADKFTDLDHLKIVNISRCECPRFVLDDEDIEFIVSEGPLGFAILFVNSMTEATA